MTPIDYPNAEFRTKPVVERLKVSLRSAAASIAKTTRDLLTRFKPGDYRPLPDTEDFGEKIEMERFPPEQRQGIGLELEQTRGRLQDLGPEFAPIIDEMNGIGREYNGSDDTTRRQELEQSFAEKKAELDAKLDELDKLRQKKNAILKLVLGAAVVTGIAGLLTAIFEAVANALGSDTAKNLVPKSTDPKNIIDSGIGQIIKKKLEELAAYFHERYVNSTGVSKAFWSMMEKSVQFMEDHLWIIIAVALAAAAYKVSKK